MEGLERIALAIESACQSGKTWPEYLGLFFSAIAALAAVFAVVVAWRIPKLLASSAALREKRAATLHLIMNIRSSDAVLERLARIYSYRRWEEKVKDYKNPYEDSYYNYEQDALCVLNFFDAACAEIEKGYVEKNLVKDVCKDMIVGAHYLLNRVNSRLEKDQYVSYEFLEKLAKEWESEVRDSEKEIPGLVEPTIRAKK